MKKSKRMEILFLPTDRGTVKVYVYGFNTPRSLGQVVVSYNHISIEAKGYYRNKTIIKALAQLHDAIVNNPDS
ncbi:hypothetical protein [Bacillus sp. KH172YL63]|uniref:hypothetical protein n=1 Tax=Bacillus sp. KH172YL63 TaxID=2709784 RepID=UPI0013E46BF0|nr:hypothetical protein [Bacillus sp. KH172YL63]BCB03162.1 hypothetical protein KH172YL63_12950 [Bacillus sp. KH172YL63]